MPRGSDAGEPARRILGWLALRSGGSAVTVSDTPTDPSHAAPEAIARYVRGELPRAEGRELERHLAGCLTCQAAVAAAGDAWDGTVRWRGHRFASLEAPEPATPAAEDDRLRGVLRGVGAATDALGAGLLAELLAASEHRRRALAARDPRFASLPLAERLARSCRAAWLDDPAAAVELARLAVAIAARLDADLYGAAPVADARALAWSQLGDSYRIVAVADSDAAIPAAGGEDDGDYPLARVAASTIGEKADGLDSLVAEPDAGGAPLAPSEAALAALDETRAACLARGMAFEAALVTLDLAAAQLRGGSPSKARDVLAAAPALLAAAGLLDEGVARFRSLAETAADLAGDTAPAGALLDAMAAVAASLGQARNDPAERFKDVP